MRPGLLKWSVSEAVRSSKLSQNMVSTSQLPVRSSQPSQKLVRLSKLQFARAKPLPEPCPLEPLFQFARLFLT
ncbi:hypothetical protein AAC387_Pa11g0823 [Persea americana]